MNTQTHFASPEPQPQTIISSTAPDKDGMEHRAPAVESDNCLPTMPLSSALVSGAERLLSMTSQSAGPSSVMNFPIEKWLKWYESSEAHQLLKQKAKEWSQNPSKFLDLTLDLDPSQSPEATLTKLFVSTTLQSAHCEVVQWVTAMLYRIRVYRRHSREERKRSPAERTMIKYGKAARVYYQLCGSRLSVALLLAKPS